MRILILNKPFQRGLHNSKILSLNLREQILLKRSREEEDKKKSIVEINKEKELKKNEDKLKKSIFTSKFLLNEFKTPFQILPSSDIERTAVNTFFNSAKVEILWSVEKIEDIPDVKLKLLKEGSSNEGGEVFELLETEIENIDKGEENSIKEQKNILKDIKSKKFDRKQKQFKVSNQNQVKILPEIILLGKCNVGKSSLLNLLCTNIKQKQMERIAYSSKIAGFTKSINCYNIGNKFHILDTPGYGKNSTKAQGEEILKMLATRDQLKKVYLLINSAHGFNTNDYLMISEILNKNGLPYSIVFTKIDKIKNLEILKEEIQEFEITLKENDFQLLPDYYFTSNEGNYFENNKRQGITELRFDFLNSCGLPLHIKPSKGMRKLII